MSNKSLSLSHLSKIGPTIKFGLFCNFRFIFALLSLMILAYLCGKLTVPDLWSHIDYIIVASLCILYFISLGVSAEAALFAAVALLPGFHYMIPILGFYLSPSEIFAIVFVLLKLKSPIVIRKTPTILLLFGFYISCLLSLIGSSYVVASMGLLIRFALVIIFCILCLSERRSNLLAETFSKGFMVTPLIALTSYLGDGALYNSIIPAVINLNRAVYSAWYPLWFSFLIPLGIFLKINRAAIVVIIIISSLIISTSFSRSLIIGFAVAIILYLLFFRLKGLGNRILKIIFLLGLFLCGYIVVFVLNFMTFSAEDGSLGAPSSQVRYSLIEYAMSLFWESPIFGSGFGAESLITVESVILGNRSSVQISFIQSLVEVGVFGTLFYVCLFYQSFASIVKVVNNQAILAEIRIGGLIAFAAMVSVSLASTAMIRLDMYIFLIYPVLLHKSYPQELRKSL